MKSMYIVSLPNTTRVNFIKDDFELLNLVSSLGISFNDEDDNGLIVALTQLGSTICYQDQVIVASGKKTKHYPFK
jgi:hypothetical protein